MPLCTCQVGKTLFDACTLDVNHKNGMESTENNFYRLIAFLVDVAPEVVRDYFKRHILCGDSFETFLNKHKHVLYHLRCHSKCCQCQEEIPHHRQHLSSEQFQVLFTKQATSGVHHSKVLCICNLKAIRNITVNVLDISLALVILQNCTHLEKDISHWMLTLKDIRNSLLHSTDTKSINDLSFENYWGKLKGAVEGIATYIEKTPFENYQENLAGKLKYLKTRHLLSDDKIKLCQLLHEWCRDKLSETEKIVLQTIKSSCDTAQQNHDDIKEMFDILKDKIDSLNISKGSSKDPMISSIDNSCPGSDLNVTCNDCTLFNVMLSMKVPSTWSTNNIKESITRLNSFMKTVESSVHIYVDKLSVQPRNKSLTEGQLVYPGVQMQKGKTSDVKTVYVLNVHKKIKQYHFQGNNTGLYLKQLIQFEEKLSPSLQKITFNGDEIKDDDIFKEKGIEDKCLVELFLHPVNDIHLKPEEQEYPYHHLSHLIEEEVGPFKHKGRRHSIDHPHRRRNSLF